MTYLVAIKSGGSVILAADTAITNRSPFATSKVAETKQTSFGESTISEPKRCVEEKMNKVIHLGKAAVAFCGDVDEAEAFISDLSFSLMGRPDVYEAINISVRNCSGSTSSNSAAKIAISFPSVGDARLLTIDTRDWCIREHERDGILQLGSMPNKFQQQTKSLMEKFAREMSGRPDRLLAITLGVLQSYGTYSALLEESVGGVFCGLAIDSSGVSWQKDILYAIHAKTDVPVEFVHCAVRDGVLVVNSSLIDECRHFVGPFNCPDSESWKRKWWDRACLQVADAKFGFVNFLNKQHRITAVVEMSGHQESKHIRFSPALCITDKSFKLNMSTSADLIERVTVPLDENLWKVVWRPYTPCEKLHEKSTAPVEDRAG